jgi:hypothetical protein
MFWESSMDSPDQNQSVIQNVAAVFSEINSSLEGTENLLSYPDSIYSNLGGGMLDSSSSLPAPSVPTRSSTTTTTTSTEVQSPSASATATPGCTGEICHTYTTRQCQGTICSCALDANEQAVCAIDGICEKTATCSANSDCQEENTVCVIQNCCYDGKGRCLSQTDTEECLNAPLCKRTNVGGMGDMLGSSSISLLGTC